MAHLDRDAPGFQQIGAAALARNRAIAVLGHVHPGARHHERGHRGDVECVGAVAPRAAGVEQGLAGLRVARVVSQSRVDCRLQYSQSHEL